jgi:hypothetical protein
MAVVWSGTQIFRRLRWSPKEQLWIIVPGIIFCSCMQESLRQLEVQNVAVRFWGGMTWAFILLFIAAGYRRYDLRLFKN